MVKELNELVDTFGVTTDTEFGLITDTLAATGAVVSEEESATMGSLGVISELIVTTYRVGNQDYELWYQVKTPFSPESMCCSFGFSKLG